MVLQAHPHYHIHLEHDITIISKQSFIFNRLTMQGRLVKKMLVFVHMVPVKINHWKKKFGQLSQMHKHVIFFFKIYIGDTIYRWISPLGILSVHQMANLPPSSRSDSWLSLPS